MKAMKATKSIGAIGGIAMETFTPSAQQPVNVNVNLNPNSQAQLPTAPPVTGEEPARQIERSKQEAERRTREQREMLERVHREEAARKASENADPLSGVRQFTSSAQATVYPGEGGTVTFAYTGSTAAGYMPLTDADVSPKTSHGRNSHSENAPMGAPEASAIKVEEDWEAQIASKKQERDSLVWWKRWFTNKKAELTEEISQIAISAAKSLKQELVVRDNVEGIITAEIAKLERGNETEQKIAAVMKTCMTEVQALGLQVNVVNLLGKVSEKTVQLTVRVEGLEKELVKQERKNQQKIAEIEKDLSHLRANGLLPPRGLAQPPIAEDTQDTQSEPMPPAIRAPRMKRRGSAPNAHAPIAEGNPQQSGPVASSVLSSLTSGGFNQGGWRPTRPPIVLGSLVGEETVVDHNSATNLSSNHSSTDSFQVVNHDDVAAGSVTSLDRPQEGETSFLSQ
jgi:hypothetical protein